MRFNRDLLWLVSKNGRKVNLGASCDLASFGLGIELSGRQGGVFLNAFAGPFSVFIDFVPKDERLP